MMIASPSISDFLQWLLLDAERTDSARAIVLHAEHPFFSSKLLRGICEYLNEYDDHGEGRWLAASDELIHGLIRDPSHRQLLGLSLDSTGENEKNELAGLKGRLAQRGHIVMYARELNLTTPGLENSFHVGIDNPARHFASCHLVLNPKLLDQGCIARIVGDVYLEWLNHCVSSAPNQE